MSDRKIIKNTSIYTIGGVLPKIAQFFLLPVFTTYMTPGDYGIVNSLQVLATVLAILFTLATDRSIFRLYFDYKKDEEKGLFFGTIAISLFTISSVVLLLIFLFSDQVGMVYQSIDFYPYYSYAIITAYLGVFSLIPKSYYQVTENPKKFVLISMLEFVSINIFTIWFVIFNEEGAIGYLKGGLIGSLVIVPFFILITKRISILRFDLKILKDSLSFSLPVIPILMAAWIMNLSDRVFIERYFTLGDVGIYSLGYKIAGLIVIFTQAFNKAYNPYFFKIANSYPELEAKKRLFRYNSVYLVVVMFFGFLISFFARDLIILLFPKSYHDAYKIVPIICLAYVVGQSSGLLNLSIYQNKKTKVVMYITLVSSGVNILLNYIFVPIWGAFGAAYATVFTFLFLLILEYQISKKYYFIPFNFKLIVPIGIILIALYLSFSFFNFDTVVNIIFKLGIMLLIMLGLYMMFRKDLVKIINK